MVRSLLAALAVVALVPLVGADDKKEPAKLTVNIFGSNKDAALAKQMPENGVIAFHNDPYGRDGLPFAAGDRALARADRP